MTVLIDYGMDSDDFGCFYMSHTYGTSIARVSETARGQHPAGPGLLSFFYALTRIWSQLRGGAHIYDAQKPYLSIARV